MQETSDFEYQSNLKVNFRRKLYQYYGLVWLYQFWIMKFREKAHKIQI